MKRGKIIHHFQMSSRASSRIANDIGGLFEIGCSGVWLELNVK